MTVVVGYTDRPESEAALRRAVEEARLRSAPLHVVQTGTHAGNENPQRARRWAEELRERERRGEALAADLRAEGIDCHYHLQTDTPSSAGGAVLGFARDLDAELIVIGMRRRSPVGKLVLGSVAQDIVLGADCPVLAVKAPGAD